MRLEGKTALVTGAGQGLGRGIALRLAEEGAAVTVNDLDAERVAATEARLRALGKRSLAVAADVSRAEAVEEMFSRHHETFGCLDILVNNVGVILIKPLWETTEAEWDRLWACNVKSVFFCARAALPLLKAQGGGKMVNLASVASYNASPMYALYCATKAAVVSLTHSLAKELAAHNIQVNAVCPGIIDSECWREEDDRIMGRAMGMTEPGEYMAYVVERSVALKRPGTPADVAAVAAFLASSDADYVTGQVYGVDGGMLYR